MHYFCEECEGVSGKLKVCETDGCHKEGEELVSCDCQSDDHKVEEE